MNFNIIIYAPSINNGGGLVLLKDLVSSIPMNLNSILFLDARTKNLFTSLNSKIIWVKPTLHSRLMSELLLFY